MPIMKQCAECGKDFSTSEGQAHRRRYCSRACAGKRFTKSCEVCGTAFSVHRCEQDSTLCSLACRYEKQKLDRPPVTFASDGAALIPIGHGAFVAVDPEDLERLSAWTWVRRDDGYAICRMNRRVVRIHRIIMHVPADMQVDHRDGDRLNCRKANLRIVTGGENAKNNVKRSDSHHSTFKGVQRSKLRWTARISADRKMTLLGSFLTEEEAARAYDAAARRLHGEFACVNFPEPGERGARRVA